jgi:hypothetical protein
MSAEVISSEKSPLGAAQKIVDELRGMTAENQKLALKFATETLGLQFPNAVPPVAHPYVQQAQPSQPQAATSAGHSADIKSFTSMKAPKSDQQFAALVAYFYQFESKMDERRDTIDAETMKDAARLAGRKQVAQWNMTLNNARNAGFLDAAGNGKFKLSSVGENLVAINLPGNGGSATNRSNNSKRKVKKIDRKKSVQKKGQREN